MRSGVTGTMPTISFGADMPVESRSRTGVHSQNFLLKFDGEEFPGFSLNENHCLVASRRAGNLTVEAKHAKDGRMLSVERFNVVGDQQTGFEEFASLNASAADQIYEGSIETALMKTAKAFTDSIVRETRERPYRQIIASIALRKGDAHLKNFALLNDDSIDGPLRLAPACDPVTTRAFAGLRGDRMPLSLNGTNRWPECQALQRLGA